jgi:hypothetical protein
MQIDILKRFRKTILDFKCDVIKFLGKKEKHLPTKFLLSIGG